MHNLQILYRSDAIGWPGNFPGDMSRRIFSVVGRAREAIEARDDQHIAVLQPADHLRQLRPIALRARGFLFVDVAAAGGLQLGDARSACTAPAASCRAISCAGGYESARTSKTAYLQCVAGDDQQVGCTSRARCSRRGLASDRARDRPHALAVALIYPGAPVHARKRSNGAESPRQVE